MTRKDLQQTIGRTIYETGQFKWDTDCLTDEGIALRDRILEQIDQYVAGVIGEPVEVDDYIRNIIEILDGVDNAYSIAARIKLQEEQRKKAGINVETKKGGKNNEKSE